MAKKKHPVYEQVSITDTGSDGLSVGKHEGMAVFVKNAVPGDVVDIQIVKKKKNYAEGRAIRFHTYSPEAISSVVTQREAVKPKSILLRYRKIGSEPKMGSMGGKVRCPIRVKQSCTTFCLKASCLP